MYGGGIFGTNCVLFKFSDCRLFFKILQKRCKDCPKYDQIESTYTTRGSDYPKNQFYFCAGSVWSKHLNCPLFWVSHFLWVQEIYSLLFLFSFIFPIWGPWMRHARQRICHLIFIKYAKGTPQSSHRSGHDEINSSDWQKNLKGDM